MTRNSIENIFIMVEETFSQLIVIIRYHPTKLHLTRCSKCLLLCLQVTRDTHLYLKDIEAREEGGTPAIVESIRAGLVFQIKQVNIVGIVYIYTVIKESSV